MVHATGLPGPRVIRHGLPAEHFATDRLEALIDAAPEGAVSVVKADRGRHRPAPPAVRPLVGELGTLLHESCVQVQIAGLERWSSDFDDLRDAVLQAADAATPRYDVRAAIRLFSPGGFLAYHAHGEAPVDCVVTGRCTWHVLPSETLSQEEHEWLHRGGQFGVAVPDELGQAFPLGPGEGITVPTRWPHWVEHHGPDPTVTFEVEYWTTASVRERKVHEVNWVLRRLRLRPAPPGRPGRRDAGKRLLFDLASRASGRGGAFRGA